MATYCSGLRTFSRYNCEGIIAFVKGAYTSDEDSNLLEAFDSCLVELNFKSEMLQLSDIE